ncbi:MAG: HAMP domain-containing histidine kinase [Oligoflexia bacterium]|nr:HAMP domain-containing histidine kinase [Oligoflexia bacterium]
MKKHFFIFHPLTIFICSLLALGLSLFLFLHWYFRITENVNAFTEKFQLNPEAVLAPHSWVIILSSSLLIGCIIVGLALIFTYYQKSIQLYYLQENFINNFTHELKTPLASIKLYLETFVKYPLSREKQLEFVNFMLKDTARLGDHVQQILLAGGLEHKRPERDFFEHVDIVQFIEKFIRNNHHLFTNVDNKLNNKLNFLPQVDATAPNNQSTNKHNNNHSIFLDINKSLFEILLMNLINNSFKHNQSLTPELTISFAVSRQSIWKNRASVSIIFSDNGVGVKKEELKKIFKKFYQGEKRKGTGLGLYICKQIVKIHQGHISASSAGPGCGAKFTLTFTTPCTGGRL